MSKENNCSITGSDWTLKVEENVPMGDAHWIPEVSLMLQGADNHVTWISDHHHILVNSLRDLADQIENWTKQNVQAIDPKDKAVTP